MGAHAVRVQARDTCLRRALNQYLHIILQDIWARSENQGNTWYVAISEIYGSETFHRWHIMICLHSTWWQRLLNPHLKRNLEAARHHPWSYSNHETHMQQGCEFKIAVFHGMGPSSHTHIPVHPVFVPILLRDGLAAFKIAWIEACITASLFTIQHFMDTETWISTMPYLCFITHLCQPEEENHCLSLLMGR